jgi:hypothetical protein
MGPVGIGSDEIDGRIDKDDINPMMFSDIINFILE